MSANHSLIDLFIVQPFITAYRVPVLRDLVCAGRWRVTVLADTLPPSDGYGAIDFATLGLSRWVTSQHLQLAAGRLVWQRGVLGLAVRGSPGVYWLSANPRDLSMWLALVLLRLRGRKVYTHGQGAYARPGAKGLYALLWRVLVALSTAYVGYTPLSCESLRQCGVPSRKLRVAHNSVSFDAALPPQQRNYAGLGVLFLGRLRARSQLDVLLRAVQEIRQSTVLDVTVEVVGDGTESQALKARHAGDPWIAWHGEVYDPQRIAEISRSCVVGCYPGDAGLSVVQYMALSLVPVVHAALSQHMGPEPSYIESGVNGEVFDKDGGAADLARVLTGLLGNPQRLAQLAQGAWSTYLQLTIPSLGQRLSKIFEEGLDERD